MRLKLGVIFGGQSSEYSVSLHSTASFLRQIHEEKYEIIKIGIDTEGHFYVYNGSIDDLEHDHWKKEEKRCADRCRCSCSGGGCGSCAADFRCFFQPTGQTGKSRG